MKIRCVLIGQWQYLKEMIPDWIQIHENSMFWPRDDSKQPQRSWKRSASCGKCSRPHDDAQPGSISAFDVWEPRHRLPRSSKSHHQGFQQPRFQAKQWQTKAPFEARWRPLDKRKKWGIVCILCTLQFHYLRSQPWWWVCVDQPMVNDEVWMIVYSSILVM